MASRAKHRVHFLRFPVTTCNLRVFTLHVESQTGSDSSVWNGPSVKMEISPAHDSLELLQTLRRRLMEGSGVPNVKSPMLLVLLRPSYRAVKASVFRLLLVVTSHVIF